MGDRRRLSLELESGNQDSVFQDLKCVFKLLLLCSRYKFYIDMRLHDVPYIYIYYMVIEYQAFPRKLRQNGRQAIICVL